MKFLVKKVDHISMLEGGIQMERSIQVTECPKCGGKDLGKGESRGYGGISRVDKISLPSPVEHIICTKCGFIIEGYVKNPEKFKGSFLN